MGDAEELARLAARVAELEAHVERLTGALLGCDRLALSGIKGLSGEAPKLGPQGVLDLFHEVHSAAAGAIEREPR